MIRFPLFSLLLAMVGLAFASVAIAAPPLAMQVSFTPTGIIAGESTTFAWSVGTGTAQGQCWFTGVPGLTTGPLSGSFVLSPTQSLAAEAECERVVGEGELIHRGSATLTVSPQPVPPTVTTSFAPATIIRGQSATFRWSSEFATACSSPQAGQVSGTAGSFSVSAPQASQSITVTCTGAGGEATSTATLTVRPAGKAQVVLVLGTGGTRLHQAGFPFTPVWVDFPALRDWNSFLLEHMSLEPARLPFAGPDDVVPANGIGVRILPSDHDLDGQAGSGCIVNHGLVFPICLMPYVGSIFGDDYIGNALRARDVDIKVVLYDWRQAWRRHHNAVAQAIDFAFARGQNEKVYVVTHSQGGLLFDSFISHFPAYRDKVAIVFNVGVPHTGSPVALTYTTPRTGGANFGLNRLGFSNASGLRLGGGSPSSYHATPSRAMMQRLRDERGHWPFEEWTVSSLGVATRVFPREDTLASAEEYLRSLVISPRLLDRGLEIQDQLAQAHHGIDSYEIVVDNNTQPGMWALKTYPPASPRPGTPPQSVVEYETIPGDGTAPTIATLGRYSGGNHRGSLVLDAFGPRGAHQDLYSNPRTIDFVHRAILIDRGESDPAFATDFPLKTDEERLASVGWGVPSAQRARSKTAAGTLAPVDVFEFTTPGLAAHLTVTVTDAASGRTQVYPASRAGVELPAPEVPDETPLTLFGRNAAPTLLATSSKLLRAGMEDDDREAPMPADAIAGDLESLDLHVPLPAAGEVRIASDRPITGVVRVFRESMVGGGAKVATDLEVGGEELRFQLDATTGPDGRLYRGAIVVPMIDDVPLPTP